MTAARECPLCSQDLGTVGGVFVCQSKACGFRSTRPWIKPPRKRASAELAAEQCRVLGECLNAAANGPFFVDRGSPRDPYWEFHALFGFTAEELRVVAAQWPDVDREDPYVSELLRSCVFHLLTYPHGCGPAWGEYFSVGSEELSKITAELGT